MISQTILKFSNSKLLQTVKNFGGKFPKSNKLLITILWIVHQRSATEERPCDRLHAFYTVRM